MSLPVVLLERVETSQRWRLSPGSFIGRMPSAALRLDEPSVSEAHALVSLRGEHLRVLALRGAIEVEGRPEDDLELTVGLEMRLAAGVTLRVLELRLPATVVALRDPEGNLYELHAPTYSVFIEPVLDLVPGLHAGASATLWSDGEGWWVRVGRDKARRLRAGATLSPPLGQMKVVDEPIQTLAVASTVAGVRGGLMLVARHTNCHIRRTKRRTVVIDGQPGRVLSELVCMGAPAEWTVLARELWPEVDAGLERDRLRRSFDRVIRRLRLKLREHGVRGDLVRTDGQGNYELTLQLGDRAVDES